MRPRFLLSFALMLLASPCLFAADTENPFKKAEKGQWASYRLKLSVNGMEQSSQVTHKITAITDKSVTLETINTMNGADAPSQKQTIDLTKPYDLLGAANFPTGKDTKVEKKDSGKESLEIGDKKYDCEWTRYSVTLSDNGMKTAVDIKIWICKTVPLHGLVKMDIKSDIFKAKMELDKTGKD